MTTVRIVVESNDHLTEVRKTDLDPAVAVAKCLNVLAESRRSSKLDAIADAAWKLATDEVS